MKKVLLLMFLPFLLLGTARMNAQVRIGGSTAPHGSAILDLNADDGNASLGFLLPRVALEGIYSFAPLSAHVKGMLVYNLTVDNSRGLSEGVYHNNGSKWFPVLSSVGGEAANAVIILRQPGFLWLGNDGDLADTLKVEMLVNENLFSYQWYKRELENDEPILIQGAVTPELVVNPEVTGKTRSNYGIEDKGKVYRFFCVVTNGANYAISGTGYAVYGPGVRLANGGWINIAPANLGAEQGMTVEEQIAYISDVTDMTVKDAAYDPTVYGDWYQWGRKKDGHEKRNVASSNTNNVYLSTLNGVGLDSLNTVDPTNDGQIKSGLEAISGKFIRRNVGTFDWRQYPETVDNSAVSPANSWTWGNPVDGITNLDPCSELNQGAGTAGVTTWRVPTQNEWAQIQNSNTWVWSVGSTSGYMVKPGGTNKRATLFLPAVGHRSRIGGEQNFVGSTGYYWSSTVASTNSNYLYFLNGSINAAGMLSRANGCTVRCVSEY